MYVNHSINDSPIIVALAAAAVTAPAMLAFAYDSDGKLALPENAGDFAAGIALANQDAVAAGDDLNVQIKDGCYWIAGEEVKAGDLLAADTTGKAVKATSGQHVLAFATEPAAADVPCPVIIARTKA